MYSRLKLGMLNKFMEIVVYHFVEIESELKVHISEVPLKNCFFLSPFLSNSALIYMTNPSPTLYISALQKLFAWL